MSNLNDICFSRRRKEAYEQYREALSIFEEERGGKRPEEVLKMHRKLERQREAALDFGKQEIRDRALTAAIEELRKDVLGCLEYVRDVTDCMSVLADTIFHLDVLAETFQVNRIPQDVVIPIKRRLLELFSNELKVSS